jgi:hypothetical protein
MHFVAILVVFFVSQESLSSPLPHEDLPSILDQEVANEITRIASEPTTETVLPEVEENEIEDNEVLTSDEELPDDLEVVIDEEENKDDYEDGDWIEVEDLGDEDDDIEEIDEEIDNGVGVEETTLPGEEEPIVDKLIRKYLALASPYMTNRNSTRGSHRSAKRKRVKQPLTKKTVSTHKI